MTDEKVPAGAPAPDKSAVKSTDKPGLLSEVPPDEFTGRDNNKKKKKPSKQKRPPKTQVEEQIDAAIAQSGLQTKRRQVNKKRFKYGMIAGAILLVGYGVYWGLKPFEGGIAYGVCKVFLENYVRYPSFLRLSTVEEFDTSVRIWYTQIDSFGEYRMEPIQCYFKQDPELGTQVEKILVNRREVDPKVVADFNRSLPVILAYPPNLVMPSPLPDSLQDLQIDVDKYRKVLLGPTAK